MFIQYKFPTLYKHLIKLSHRKKLLEEFKKEVGKNNSVFDVAAGFGNMANFIDKSNSYYGIDINQNFIDYAAEKGIKVANKNIFKKSSYINSEVFVVVDVIHHLKNSELLELFDLIYSHANKKVIILEPCFLNLKSRHSMWGGVADKILMLLDNDGTNKIHSWPTQEEYQEMFKDRFGAKNGKNFTYNQKTIYPYWLVVYEKINS